MTFPLPYLVLCLLVAGLLVALLAGLVPRGGLAFRTTPTREQGLLLAVFPATIVLVGILGRNLPLAVFMTLSTAVIGLQSWGPKRWRGGRVWGAGPIPLALRSWERIDGVTTLTLSLGYRLKVVDRPENRPFLDALGTSDVPGLVAPPLEP